MRVKYEKRPKKISEAIAVLKQNLIKIAQVEEWAHLMGYSNP